MKTNIVFETYKGNKIKEETINLETEYINHNNKSQELCRIYLDKKGIYEKINFQTWSIDHPLIKSMWQDKYDIRLRSIVEKGVPDFIFIECNDERLNKWLNQYYMSKEENEITFRERGFFSFVQELINLNNKPKEMFGDIYLIEAKSGYSQLSENQKEWFEKYSDEVDSMVVRTHSKGDK